LALKIKSLTNLHEARMMEVDVDCPYCGEPNTLAIDETGGRAQTYIEDCTVCCRPIEVTARYDGEGFEVTTGTEDMTNEK